jgi:thymidylate synthase
MRKRIGSAAKYADAPHRLLYAGHNIRMLTDREVDQFRGCIDALRNKHTNRSTTIDLWRQRFAEFDERHDAAV